MFRKTKPRSLLLWILLLSIALLCAQSVTLHVHGLDHGSDHELNQLHDNIAPELMSEHSHLSETHL